MREYKREREILHTMTQCKHFRSIQHQTCQVGINIRQLVGGDDFGWARRMPCLSSEHCTVECESRELHTREEAEADYEKTQQIMQQLTQAVTITRQDATDRGLMIGRGGVGEVGCPVCSTGTIKYSVASVNGHMWGKCSTAGCVAWME